MCAPSRVLRVTPSSCRCDMTARQNEEREEGWRTPWGKRSPVLPVEEQSVQQLRSLPPGCLNTLAKSVVGKHVPQKERFRKF